jgi:hypothetical protein
MSIARHRPVQVMNTAVNVHHERMHTTKKKKVCKEEHTDILGVAWRGYNKKTPWGESYLLWAVFLSQFTLPFREKSVVSCGLTEN